MNLTAQLPGQPFPFPARRAKRQAARASRATFRPPARSARPAGGCLCTLCRLCTCYGKFQSATLFFCPTYLIVIFAKRGKCPRSQPARPAVHRVLPRQSKGRVCTTRLIPLGAALRVKATTEKNPMKSCCSTNSAQQQPLDLVGASRYWPRDRPPRRDAILAMLDSAVDWAGIEAMIRPVYESDIRRRGRRGYSMKMMVRIMALAWLWQASDRATENALMDSKALARFVGLDAWTPRPPSASAIRAFRDLLKRTAGPDHIFDMYQHLVDALRGGIHAAGLEFRHGTISEPVFRRALSPLLRPAPASEVNNEVAEQ